MVTVSMFTHVQECRPCHPLCDGCDGPLTGNCDVCKAYNELDVKNCVESCKSDYYTDELMKQCIPCDEQCLECHGPSAANCTSCQHMKLYNDLEDTTEDSAVSIVTDCFDIN